jgi:hypothetical protein
MLGGRTETHIPAARLKIEDQRMMVVHPPP